MFYVFIHLLFLKVGIQSQNWTCLCRVLRRGAPHWHRGRQHGRTCWMQQALLVNSQLIPGALNNLSITSHRMLFQTYVELLCYLLASILACLFISQLCNNSTELCDSHVTDYQRKGCFYGRESFREYWYDVTLQSNDGVSELQIIISNQYKAHWNFNRKLFQVQ